MQNVQVPNAHHSALVRNSAAAVAGQISINLLALGFATNWLFDPVPPAMWIALSGIGFAVTWLAMQNFASALKLRNSEQVEKLIELLRHDALTGTLNRSFFLDQMRSQALPGALLVIDVDHFKKINDRFGHYTGDAALTHLAACMLKHVPKGYVGRLGGEEFAVFLPGRSLDEGCAEADQLRGLIQDSEFEFDNKLHVITVSIGVASHNPDFPIGRTLRVADDNLYAAKKSGRNCVAAHANTVRLIQNRLGTTERQAISA